MSVSPPPAARAAPAGQARLPLPRSLFGVPVFYGWYIVAIAFLATAMSSGISAYSLGIFVTPMEEELGWSRTQLSLGQTASTAGMGVIAGAAIGFGTGALALGPLVQRLQARARGEAEIPPRFVFVVESNGVPPQQVAPPGIKRGARRQQPLNGPAEFLDVFLEINTTTGEIACRPDVPPAVTAPARVFG